MKMDAAMTGSESHAKANPTQIRASYLPDMSKRLTLSQLNQGVVRCEYAIRGRVPARAMELDRPGSKMPITYCNIGNPQSLGQPPLTFVRQVLSLCAYPQELLYGKGQSLFPKDARDRAEKYLAGMAGKSSGSYSHSKGIPVIRQDVADFIERRDGVPCDFEDIFLTDGASPAAQMMMRLLIASPNDGIMIPVPRYPLYSAVLDTLNGRRVEYYLNEDKGWQLDRSELERAYKSAVDAGTNPKAMVVVNPGNPTGQVMSVDSLKDVVTFCRDKSMVLIADEVYQENIWSSGSSFTSMKKIARKELGYQDVQLASLHSTSKGFITECGRRGGYVELSGFSQDVKNVVYKLASVNLCANIDGQIAVGLMCNPPKAGDESFELYEREKTGTLASMKRRADSIASILSTPDGTLSCVAPAGAMYAFPRVKLPQKFIDAFPENPDEAYCLQLLERTGVVLVPGSGFGQEKGTYHFRVTVLPSESVFSQLLKSVVDFHLDVCRKYA